MNESKKKSKMQMSMLLKLTFKINIYLYKRKNKLLIWWTLDFVSAENSLSKRKTSRADILTHTLTSNMKFIRS